MANTDEQTLGEHIRGARLETDYSLRGLAKALTITPSYLSDIENDRRVPSEEVLRAIATKLDLEFDDLMARAFRFGEDVERYIKRHPAVGALFRKITERQLSDTQLRELAAEVDQMRRRKKS